MSYTYYRFRYRCTQGHGEVYETLRQDEGRPTMCKKDTSHQIDIGSITIVDVISKNIVKVQEETNPTGGYFRESSLKIVAPANSSVSQCWVLPIPMNALAIEFVTEEVHRGDSLDMTVAENTPIGMVTTSVSPIDSSSAFNPLVAYTVNSVVTFTHPHPLYGTRIYTCIKATLPGVLPINTIGFTNTEYWIHGYPLHVDNTVIENAQRGFFLSLIDMATGKTSDLDIILYADTNKKILYTQNGPSNTLTFPYTVVKLTIYVVKDYIIGGPWKSTIGGNKIGGSYVREDAIVTARYHNKSLTGEPKIVVGSIEFLY